MSEVAGKPSSGEHLANTNMPDIAELRRRWSWCAKLGVALIILGLLAISLVSSSSMSSVWLLSWLIVVSGIVEGVHAFHLRKSGGFFFHLVPGIAGVPLGLLIATHPAVGTVTWMLVYACFFTVVGLFRLISAVRLKFRSWPWAVFDSVVMLLLGCVFWTTWTWLGSWFFAVAVGISLILRGWSSIMLGLALRGRRTWIRTRLSAAEGARNITEHRPTRTELRQQISQKW